jgi:hypothetical protein
MKLEHKNEHKNGDNIQTLHKNNAMKLELVKNLQTKLEIKNIVKISRNHFFFKKKC